MSAETQGAAEQAFDDVWEERGRLREALFTLMGKLSESDEWDAECDEAVKRALLPLGHHRAARPTETPEGR